MAVDGQRWPRHSHARHRLPIIPPRQMIDTGQQGRLTLSSPLYQPPRQAILVIKEFFSNATFIIPFAPIPLLGCLAPTMPLAPHRASAPCRHLLTVPTDPWRFPESPPSCYQRPLPALAVCRSMPLARLHHSAWPGHSRTADFTFQYDADGSLTRVGFSGANDHHISEACPFVRHGEDSFDHPSPAPCVTTRYALPENDLLNEIGI